MAVVALAALIVKANDTRTIQDLDGPVFLPCSVGGTGEGTLQTTNSMIPPSGVMFLNRVIRRAGMLAVMPTTALTNNAETAPARSRGDALFAGNFVGILKSSN